MCLLRILCFVNFCWHLYSVNLASVVRWIVDSFWCWLLLAALPPISIKLIGLVTRLLAELNGYNLRCTEGNFSGHFLVMPWKWDTGMADICLESATSSLMWNLFCPVTILQQMEDKLKDKLFGRQDIFYCVWHGCEFQNCQYFTDSSLFSKLSPEPMHKHIVWCFCDQKIIFIYSSSHINHARRPADNAV